MRGVRANGPKIRKLRKAHGLTQEDLAMRADCDAKTVRKAEQGKNLDFHSIGKIAAVLGGSFPDVLARGRDPQAEQLQNKQLAEAWVDAFNRRDIDLLMTFFHPGAVFRAPGAPDLPFGGEFRGHEQIRRMHEVTFQSGQTEPITRDMFTIYAAEDCVFLHGSATLRSPLGGAEAKLWAIHMLRFADGKIVEFNANYDALAVHKVISATNDPRANKEA